MPMVSRTSKVSCLTVHKCRRHKFHMIQAAMTLTYLSDALLYPVYCYKVINLVHKVKKSTTRIFYL